MTPKPSVGRIVHYMTRGSADRVYPPVPFASIITQVHTDTCVDLVTFGPSGMRFETSVQFDVNHMNQPGTWHWPKRDDSTGSVN